MTRRESVAWNLESFLDSLIYELDKAQDTLSVKGINRKLTYTVKDVALDLYVFPEYQKDQIMFNTARPGDRGASKLSLQLGSISDRQIRETTKQPMEKDDIAIDLIDEIEPEVKDSLKKVGVNTAEDLKRMQNRNVDLRKVVKEKTGKDTQIDYGDLAGLINKARRRNVAPRVTRISKSRSATGDVLLTLEGKNLYLSQGLNAGGFPMGLLNSRPVTIVCASTDAVTVQIPRSMTLHTDNDLILAMDPYAVMRMKVKV
ncbi:MAG: hypothetical protein ACOCW2_00500 [Chitinivibrionales bacterium]